MLLLVMYDEYCISCRYLGEMKSRLILPFMCISYCLEASCDHEDLTKTLYRLNKEVCAAGVLLILQCEHKYCTQIDFE